MSTIVDNADGLGKRVRDERARRAWSLSRLAEASGVSRAMISKVERGQSSPTAAVLGRLAAAFDLSVSALLERAEDAGAHPVRRADAVPAWSDPETRYLRRQISTPSFPADVTDVVLPAGQRVPYPAAAYAFHAQLVWVLDGELTLTDGADVHVLTAGDVFELGVPAAREFANPSDADCRYVVVVSRRETP
ncbi:helix-turn-helix domain-containing protein [Myceligenerans indicum]|uniref:Helix-turn-helix domain-containing protein n=1 Tax=Myceligenerans indicum TaxID=2593663 RepID=A0ABS1LGR6_9MICO|nr:helix-turn-helix transcriptional regulator [Myceligenerans indicum]MBL0885421.1 helix-turn-helix domain-containing protein [Myceligenerans indicum]